MRGHTSLTALAIAHATLFADAGEHLRAALPPELADVNRRLLTAARLTTSLHRRAYRQRALRGAVDLGERLLAPGFVLHVVLRKRQVYDAVRQALAGGVRQVVVVAAGLDGLAALVARERADVCCVEVDHPSTQATKAAALRATGLSRPNLVLVAADLSQMTLADALAGVAGFDPGKPSVAVVEGLLMYLDVGAVRGLFGGLAEVGVSELVLTWLDGDARGRAPTVDRSTLAAFRALGEPLRWAASPETVAALLTEAGYALALDDEPALRRRYLLGTPLADAPLAMIERVGCARRIEGTG